MSSKTLRKRPKRGRAPELAIWEHFTRERCDKSLLELDFVAVCRICSIRMPASISDLETHLKHCKKRTIDDADDESSSIKKREDESGLVSKKIKRKTGIETSFVKLEEQNFTSPVQNIPDDNNDSGIIEFKPTFQEFPPLQEQAHDVDVKVEVLIKSETELIDDTIVKCESVLEENTTNTLTNAKCIKEETSVSDNSVPVSSQILHEKATSSNKSHKRDCSRPWRGTSPNPDCSDPDISEASPCALKENCEEPSNSNHSVPSSDLTVSGSPSFKEIFDEKLIEYDNNHQATEDSGSDDEEDCAPEVARSLAAELALLLPDSAGLAAFKDDARADAAAKLLLPPPQRALRWRTKPALSAPRQTFTGRPGPTFPLTDVETPLDVFLKIWDREIMDTIVERTDRYARETYDQNGVPDSTAPWHPTDAAELYVFIAQLLHQSLVPVPTDQGYCHPTLRDAALPSFEQHLSPERFDLLKRVLYFADYSSGSDGETRERRQRREIRPLVDYLNKKFQTLFLPGRYVTLDESVVGIPRRLEFLPKIYNYTHTEDRGISYEVCDEASGYLWSFKISLGRSDLCATDKKIKESENEDRSSGSVKTAVDDEDSPDSNNTKIVIELLSPLFERGHALAMDSTFNTPFLTRYLKLQKTDSFGPLRLTRDGIPKSFKTKTAINEGDSARVSTRDMNIAIFQYKSNFVRMISSYHEKNMGSTQIPKSFLDYVKCKKSVDRKNEILARFPMVVRPDAEWYTKVFKWLLIVSVNNAYIIYKYKDPNISPRKFRLLIAEALSEKYKGRRVEYVRAIREYCDGSQPRKILVNNHYSEKLEKAAQCVLCAQKDRRQQTTRQCDVCRVPLCITCMKPYHEEDVS